ncbi:MAG: hypothetical protein ACOH1Y_04810 [Propionicimonas sp.]
MRVFRTAFSLLSGLVLLATLAPPAEATPRSALTCGMVINTDANVYLAHDLTCPDFGIRVEYDHSGDVPPPHVRVDLRGHTLRGPGTGNGITAFSGGLDPSYVEVLNGRLKNWGIAVGGDFSFHTRNVALVDSGIGFACGGLDCVADRTQFRRNSNTGFSVGADAGGTVTRSTFVHNAVGASVIFISGLTIDHSVFRKNDVGVLANDAVVTVSRSLFVKNHTAVQVLPFGDDGDCARLSRDVFVRNGVRLDGPRCTP